MGVSTSTAKSSLEVDQTTVDSYAGTCDFKCDNKITGVYVDLINTTLTGGLKIQQQCSVDGTCSISTGIDSLVDTVAKASSSSNAKDVGILQGILDKSESDTRVKISDYLDQEVYNSCKVEGSNDITNLDIFAVNSNIQGGILIGQKQNIQGNCAFQTSMKAVQKASGNANASSLSGKDKKGEKCGSCTGLQTGLIYIGIAIAAVIGLTIAAYFIYKYANRSPSAGSTTTASSSIGSVGSQKGSLKSYLGRL
jgi:hypothetical protein